MKEIQSCASSAVTMVVRCNMRFSVMRMMSCAISVTKMMRIVVNPIGKHFLRLKKKMHMRHSLERIEMMVCPVGMHFPGLQKYVFSTHSLEMRQMMVSPL